MNTTTKRLWLGLTTALVFQFARDGLMAASFTDITQPPSAVEVVLADKVVGLSPGKLGQWSGAGVEITIRPNLAGVVSLKAPGVPVKKVHLHWAATFDTNALVLGDAWERAYGDLQWKPLDRAGSMPWYFLVSDGTTTDGYGVMTGPAALCCWKVNASGIDLWADVRSGGVGVELGNRTLTVCTITARQGRSGENAFAAACAFCRQMCPQPRVVRQPVYGFNDWYCAYGANSAKAFLKDAAFITSLSPTSENKPFMVIDDGWQANRQGGKDPGNPWQHTNAKFGSTMPEVATAIKAMHARPGLWYRPLQAWPDCPVSWRLSGRSETLDPSNPEVLKDIAQNVKRFRDWGFEMIKHDFSTDEITGRWGNRMGDEVTSDGWAFSDRSRTTAEIVLNFYRTLREAAGDNVLLNGCNTMSHLSAGIFELARIGDDTSGTDWNRTRQMGVNCLAFRAAQNGAFYLVDADCSGLAKTNAVPWAKNSQWLDLLARSGTPLFVSWPQRLVGPEQESALRAALASGARAQPLGEPLDWLNTRTPTQWKLNGNEVTFKW
jgi:alpha-galactosidase